MAHAGKAPYAGAPAVADERRADRVQRTLIVGLGRAGLGLHWAVLSRLREAPATAQLLSPEPAVVHDVRDVHGVARQHGLVVAETLSAARSMLEPASTVVHVCTPPSARIDLLRRLAQLGFRHILVEKPLAPDVAVLRQIVELKRAHQLRIAVVGHWLDSSLTRRIVEVVSSGRLGALRSISSLQCKPRLSRSLRTTGHPTAFDVEVPHILGVALRVAGDADVVAAGCTDMHVDGRILPRMGSAHLVLRHTGGVRTEVVSDLTSPVRERRITLELSGGRLIGHYPGSQDDSYAQLETVVHGRSQRALLPDDSLATFLARVYGELAAGTDSDEEFRLNLRVSELIADAKSMALPCADIARAVRGA